MAAAFEDAGESEKTTERPEFQRMLEFCRRNKGRIRYLVVLNLTRFSRNAHDHHVIRALLARLGISLRSVSEPISDDPAGRLTENMLAAIAQFDNDQKAHRSKTGMLAALERGRWPWRAPLGYLNGNVRLGEPSLCPDPERSAAIRRAFEFVSTGRFGVSDVLQKVTALGLRTRKGKRLTAQTFGALLKNPTYAGVLTAPGFGIEGVRGDFQPLISHDLFARVQCALRQGRGNTGSRCLKNPEFPLRRFVICDACGTPLTGSAPRGRSRTYAYYHCRKCKGLNVRREVLEQRFVDLLESLSPKPEFTALFRAIVVNAWKQREGTARTVREQLTRRIEELQRRENRLDEVFLYERGIDRETYERQRDRLREEIALARIEEEDARIEEIDVEALVDYSEQVLLSAARLWTDASFEQRLRLQQVLFPQGLRWNEKGFGIAVTCLAFSQLPLNTSESNDLASPTGFEPVFWP